MSCQLSAVVMLISSAVVSQTKPAALSRLTRYVTFQVDAGISERPVRGKTNLPLLDVGLTRPRLAWGKDRGNGSSGAIAGSVLPEPVVGGCVNSSDL